MQFTQSEAVWDSVLAELAPGEVRCLFTENVTDSLETLQRGAAHRVPVTPTMVLTWANAPRIDLAIREIALEFAIASSAAWPRPAAAEHASMGHTSTRLSESSDRSFAHDAHWFRKARSLIRQGKPPLPAGYPLGESVRRLASCWSAKPVTCILALEDHANRHETHLDGLCRGAQWVAQQTGGCVALLMPARFRGDSALASVDFESVTISESTTESTAEPTAESIEPHAESPRDCSRSARPKNTEEKNKYWPLLGNPHPFSPGEQKLASALSEHPELRGRFTFNTVIETESQQRYIVDLLDRELRLVVEVDGYRHHSGRVAFSADRERDFHLTVDGYLVLRIPHHEIIDDIEYAVQKILTLVHYRQETPY